MMTLNRLLLVGGMIIGLWFIAPAASSQERYHLTVQPTPADSRVRILNIRSPYQPGVRLPPGAYHLEISHKGYRTVTQWVHLMNQPLTVDVTLPPLESQATVAEPAPPMAEPQPPPAAAPGQPAQPEPPPATVAPRTEAAAPRKAPRTEAAAPRKYALPAADAVLAAALQSGDLRYWQDIFATPPPNTEWLSALRVSPIYWLLSPMTWLWLLQIWAVLACWNRGWRLSTFGRLGLLALILALPISWLCSWILWAGFVALLVGLVILWDARSLPRSSKETNAVIFAMIGVGIGSAFGSAFGSVIIIGDPRTESSQAFGAAFGAALGALLCSALGAEMGAAIGREMDMGWIGNKIVKVFALIFAPTVAMIGMVIFGMLGAALGARIGVVIGVGIGAGIIAVASAHYAGENLGIGAEMDVGIGAAIGVGIGAGIIAEIGEVMGILYLQSNLQSNFWSHYFSTTALDSLLLIGAIMLAWLVLGLMSVLLSARFWPWLKAKRQVTHRICQKDYHRFRLGSGLPWPVRWSGRLLMVEEPRQHQDFADYFVCRVPSCGQRDFVTARRLIGVIGAMPSATAPGELSVSLFDPDKRQASSADIDCLDIHPPPPNQTLDYDYAVNAVLNALSEDHHRSRSLKKIPVRIHDRPPLPENTRRMLADRFNLLSY